MTKWTCVGAYSWTKIQEISEYGKDEFNSCHMVINIVANLKGWWLVVKIFIVENDRKSHVIANWMVT